MKSTFNGYANLSITRCRCNMFFYNMEREYVIYRKKKSTYKLRKHIIFKQKNGVKSFDKVFFFCKSPPN